MKQAGTSDNFNFNKFINDRKDFRNPSLYEHLVAMCDLDEFGTNFPPVSLFTKKCDFAYKCYKGKKITFSSGKGNSHAILNYMI